MNTILSLRQVRKRFGDQLLFDIDRLDIRPAHTYILLGVNGSGKSTLMRILGGLETADIGAATFLDQAIRLNPYPKALRQAIVYVHQHPIMLSGSVSSNVGYGLRQQGVSGEAYQRRVEEAMAWAGIAHLHQHNPLTLSGGEKQRVALARAKVLNPRLLLLDEPTANLDDRARKQVLNLIPDLIQTGSSIMIASHDPLLRDFPSVRHMELTNGQLKLAYSVD
jgi:tungstate transport system ATP-binding protein